MSQEAKDKLEGIFRKVFESDLDPIVTKTAFEEARGCFEGHDELLREWDELWPKMDTELLDRVRITMRMMRERAASIAENEEF